jgi:hypothetical protein
VSGAKEFARVARITKMVENRFAEHSQTVSRSCAKSGTQHTRIRNVPDHCFQ